MSRLVGSLLLTVLVAVVLFPALGEVAAGTCSTWAPEPANVGDHDNELKATAAVSACSLWAVGYYSDGSHHRTLIEHWTGRAWRVVPSPNVGMFDNELLGVTAASASRAWAVGFSTDASSLTHPLILRWNGVAWKIQPSPDPPGGTDALKAVAATSVTNAWAVGYRNDGVNQTLIEHWNGIVWKRQASPNGLVATLPVPNTLSAVSGTSGKNAWAVGTFGSGPTRTLILHRDGKAWRLQRGPNAGADVNDLFGVTAVSAKSAWAVGSSESGGGTIRSLVVHWNGKAWKIQSSPNAPSFSVNDLRAVDATSPSNVWAVGTIFNGARFDTFVLHWNGSVWSIQSSPNHETGVDKLFGVVAVTSTDVWAVGSFSSVVGLHTMAIHCC